MTLKKSRRITRSEVFLKMSRTQLSGKVQVNQDRFHRTHIPRVCNTNRWQYPKLILSKVIFPHSITVYRIYCICYVRVLGYCLSFLVVPENFHFKSYLNRYPLYGFLCNVHRKGKRFHLDTRKTVSNQKKNRCSFTYIYSCNTTNSVLK